MGGHAFKDLDCPRMAPAVYQEIKLHTTTVLQKIFPHVVVPTEMPEKTDYGDVDFLVSPASSTTIDKYDWAGTVTTIKKALDTTHGRRGYLTPDCMYFAIAADEHEDFWIQIDVKVCFKPELFTWSTFEYNYASNSKIIGSMLKPLGFTLDPEGLHIRMEEMEDTNFPGSMIWVSKDPKDVLKIIGLDRRLLDAGFDTKTEIYKSFTSSWLFNAAHFAARLSDEKYSGRLEERAPHWMEFLKEWLPENYPEHQHSAQQVQDLQAWYKSTRAAVRDKVFTMFPHIAEKYYTKRAVYMKEIEEHRLRDMITKAIPAGSAGWKEDFPQPLIIVKGHELTTPPLQPTIVGELTPPLTPTMSIDNSFEDIICRPGAHDELTPPPSRPTSRQGVRSQHVPLYLERLDRTPPMTCLPRPPPANMSPEARILCLARWTSFDLETGAPYLISAPHPKDFTMHWADAAYAGATDEVLVDWAENMWWSIWIRQSHVNFIGMWKKRLEKEDRKAGRARLEVEAKFEEEKIEQAQKEKMMGRLRRFKMSL
ncbi:hypothetical protein NX059_008319 [Plenodomus lindquistii]|nr:hypothetical protein NX059_008319 [Plenodomus lindquistii]